MKITILTVGSRGDVQPYIALARGLCRAGHQVTLATLEGFGPSVLAEGLAFHPLRGQFLELMQTPEGQAVLAGKGGRMSLLRKVMPMYRLMLDDELEAAREAELIIYHPKALGGPSLAEYLGVPSILALPLPLYSPTADWPSPIVPLDSLGPFNRVSHRMLVWLAVAPVRGTLNQWRKQSLELGPAGNELRSGPGGQALLRLYGYSPTVLPSPPDWDARSVATGYWFLDHEPTWQPPADLEVFLQAGPPPVYVGFGSMTSQDAAAKTQLVVAALERAGQRGVLASGWGGLAKRELPASIYQLEAAPHDWLFPRMAAVVHHGGAGTTAAGLRAGRPTVICPFFGDQPFWGKRVAALGAGPAPLAQRRLTIENLTAAISAAVSDPAMANAAARVGAAIRAEDGIARAVELIEAEVAMTTP
ncbi:MAG: glycosyltransferase [Oscillochloridaceae bacterium umkhey_bin13]